MITILLCDSTTEKESLGFLMKGDGAYKVMTTVKPVNRFSVREGVEELVNNLLDRLKKEPDVEYVTVYLSDPMMAAAYAHVVGHHPLKDKLPVFTFVNEHGVEYTI